MNKKLSLVLGLVILLSFALTACKTGSEPEPGLEADQVLEKFLAAMKDFDDKAMDRYLLEDEDTMAEEFEDIKKDENMYGYFKENAGRMDYEVLEVTEEGDGALAKVNFKYLDGKETLSVIMSKFFSEVMAESLKAGGDLEPKKTAEIYSRVFKENLKQEEDFLESQLEIKLKKEDKKWYVVGPRKELINILYSDYLSYLDLEDLDVEDMEVEEID